MAIGLLRLLLVEDDELFRLGLQVRLQQESGIEIVAEAEDGETALELVERYPFDVVLMDVGLPGVGGVEACRQIKQKYPNLPVLVLTSHSQQALIDRLIAVGAQGYCLKGIGAETLILALKSVAAGASWWDQTATQAIRASLETHSSPSITAETTKANNLLTQREQEILELIAVGKNNQEIAQILYITPGTVRVHVHAILQKLQARDRAQAVIIARQKALISSNP
jgi:two-component system, NarL family, response regulator